MNVFILDLDVNVSAKKLFVLDAVRARKQIVELCQMLAQSTNGSIPKVDGSPYKHNKSLNNHPATVWVSANRSWNILYLQALIKEYQEITGKTHGCTAALDVLLTQVIEINNIQLGWFSKKADWKDLGDNIIDATHEYILAKQKGLYKN